MIEKADAERFIQLVADGVPLATAARQCGTTSSRMKIYVRRYPVLHKRFDEAMDMRRKLNELCRLLQIA